MKNIDKANLKEEIFDSVLKYLDNRYLLYKPYVLIEGDKLFTTYEFSLELQKKFTVELQELEQLINEKSSEFEISEKRKEIKNKVKNMMDTLFNNKLLEVSSLELELREPIFKFTLMRFLNDERNGVFLSKNLTSIKDLFKVKNHIALIKEGELHESFFPNDFNAGFVKFILDCIYEYKKINLLNPKLTMTKQEVWNELKVYINSIRIY